MNKKYLSLLPILFALIGFVSLRLSSPEDSWICKEGIWIKHGNPNSAMPSTACPGSPAPTNNTNATAKEVVENFYNWYLRFEGNPLSSGAYKTSSLLSSDFVAQVDKQLSNSDRGGIDPFICAQDLPQKFNLESDGQGSKSAFVETLMDYGSSQKRLKINLIKYDNKWLIDSIDCSSAATNKEETKVIVYFSNSRRAANDKNCGLVFGVQRFINPDTNTYEAALNQLFQGPSNSEKAQGYTSMFSVKTKNILKSLKVEKGVAYVNLTDIRSVLSNASSSCGSAEFLAQVEETLKHDRKINKVFFAIDGNPQTFYDWIQVGCDSKINNCDPKPFSN